VTYVYRSCLKNIKRDFFQTNYLNIQQTDLDEICRNGKTLSVDNLSRDVAMATNFLLTESTPYSLYRHAISPKRHDISM